MAGLGRSSVGGGTFAALLEVVNGLPLAGAREAPIALSSGPSQAFEHAALVQPAHAARTRRPAAPDINILLSRG